MTFCKSTPKEKESFLNCNYLSLMQSEWKIFQFFIVVRVWEVGGNCALEKIFQLRVGGSKEQLISINNDFFSLVGASPEVADGCSFSRNPGDFSRNYLSFHSNE